MSSFIEYDENTKVLKYINLDDFSIEDLEEYIEKISLEIDRAEAEIKKRLKTKDEALKFFK